MLLSNSPTWKRRLIEFSKGVSVYQKFSSVQFILFAFINYSTKLHIVIIHLAGSPRSYFAYLKDCLEKRSKKLECKLSMAEQK